ncbi:hypothetical protein GYH30_005466 [Glycine max]|uniref:Uncharacterized protein n=1 Tax=Glycine max TaxID=3847 RepID=A0A0R0L2C9_SOYBN|nr:hypothetical protein GYH30_005466 [Glycine max]
MPAFSTIKQFFHFKHLKDQIITSRDSTVKQIKKPTKVKKQKSNSLIRLINTIKVKSCCMLYRELIIN